MATGSKKKNETVKIRTEREYHAPVRPNDTTGDPTNRAYVLKELIPTHKSENPLRRSRSAAAGEEANGKQRKPTGLSAKFARGTSYGGLVSMLFALFCRSVFQSRCVTLRLSGPETATKVMFACLFRHG